MQTPSFPIRASSRRLHALLLPTLLAVTSAAVLVASPPAAAQAGAAPGASQLADPEVAAALARFDEAGAGDHAAIEDAAERLARLSATRPADPVLRAYAGAALAMRALTTRLPWRTMSHTEDGLALVDKALAQLGPVHEAPLYRGVPASLKQTGMQSRSLRKDDRCPDAGHLGQQLRAFLADPGRAVRRRPLENWNGPISLRMAATGIGSPSCSAC